MKKLIQKIYCTQKRTVRDMMTGSEEVATFHKVFGFVVRTTYIPIESEPCDHSDYLGISLKTN